SQPAASRSTSTVGAQCLSVRATGQNASVSISGVRPGQSGWQPVLSCLLRRDLFDVRKVVRASIFPVKANGTWGASLTFVVVAPNARSRRRRHPAFFRAA